MIVLWAFLLLRPGNPDESIRSINAFHFVDQNLASSGNLSLDQYRFIKAHGYQHVINLLPGNQLQERKHVESLGLSYTQIPVDWASPTMENLEAFVKRMNELKGTRVYVHCAANMRASAFIFVYRVTQLGVDKKTARAHMDSVWFPTKQWNDFIRNGLTKYGKDPEWRLFGKGAEIIRSKGVQPYRQMKRSPDFKVEREELLNLGLATLNEEKDSLKAIDIYRLCAEWFPDDKEAYLRLGDLLREMPTRRDEAVNHYRQYLTRFPMDIWGKRYLGRLNVSDYKSYWEGVPYDAAAFASLLGSYEAKGQFDFVIGQSGANLTFKTPWMNEPALILMDPDGNFFVTRWRWKFDLKPGAKSVAILHEDGTTLGERKQP